MALRKYPGVFFKERKGGYTVRFPDVDCAYSQGRTLAECIRMGREALMLALDMIAEDQKPAPRPSPAHHARRAAVSDYRAPVAGVRLMAPASLAVARRGSRSIYF
ncbi:MAG: type II toxin-antitoxin system HicB family antitoxin [Rhodospirillaceae bacterium]